MDILDPLVRFGLVVGLLVVTPGLDTALVLSSTLTQGRRLAAVTAAGIACGLVLWGATAATGGAVLLSSSRVASDVVRLAGAAYLIYLGAVMVIRTLRGDAPADRIAPTRTAGPTPGARRAFLTGFTTNVLNPKIGVFYVTVVPPLVPDGASPVAVGTAMAMLHAVLTLAWLAVVIAASGAARALLSQARALRIIDRLTGGVLVALGTRVALDRH